MSASAPPVLTGTVLEVPGSNSLDFLETAFDCYARAQVFAISRPDTSLADMGLTTERADPVPEAEQRRGWGRFSHTPDTTGTPAQIVFTSGTEGPPKAILLSQRNLADVVTRLNTAMQVTGEIREYIGVPVTYSFGLGRARAVAAAGGAFFLPERFDPSEIARMLVAGEINAISAVPSLWKIVLNMSGVIGDAGARVRWIEIGSQYMSGEDKAAMRRLFPNAQILQHYGLTEASRSTFLDITAHDGDALESVGAAMGSVETRIGPDGAIAIRGDHVAMGRLMPGGGLEPLTDADGWLVTKDQGRLEDGLLYYLGRLDNQINVSGVKLSAEGLEQEIAALVPGAEGHFAATGAEDDRRGEIVLLGTEEAAGDLAGLVEEAAAVVLSRRGLAPAGVLRVIRVPALPRTGTDKIQRSGLRDLQPAAAPEAAVAAPDPALTDAEAALADSWRSVVGQTGITGAQSFYDLGGDSLSSVQVGLVMEAARYNRASIRATLEGRSLADVAALADPETGGKSTGTETHSVPAQLPDQTHRNWALNITRSFMVLSVLLSHWGAGFFSRIGLSENPGGFMNLFYRIGTPGFATVFGIGIGLFMLPVFRERRAAIVRRTRVSLLFVLAGLAMLAGVHIALMAAGGMPLTGRTLAVSFYGVLTFYAIALATAPVWLAGFAALSRPMTGLILAVPLLVWAWQMMPALVPGAVQENVLELPRLMLIAGYNVFKMGALTCAGIALGYWLSLQTDTQRLARPLLGLGAFGGVLCLMALMQTAGPQMLAERAHPGYVSITGLSFYVFLSIFVLGGSLALTGHWYRLPGLLRRALQLLIALGGLALPVYVFHGLVIPLRDLLVVGGLGGGVALVLPMGAFVALIGYGMWRLHRLYFG